MAERAGSVTCVGLTTLDVVQVVDRVPGPDEKTVAHDGWITVGGPAANAAATVAALGVPVRLVSAVGSGPAADVVRAELARLGVELVDLARQADGVLPVSTVLVVGAGRAVVSRNATAAPDLSEAATAVTPPEPGDVVLVDGHHLGAALAVAAAGRRVGARTLLDGGSWKPGLQRLLALVDVAVVSADFRLPSGAGGASVPADPSRTSGRSATVRAAGTSGPSTADGASALPSDEVDALLDALVAFGPTVTARSGGGGPLRARLADGTRMTVTPRTVPVVYTLGAGDVLHGAVAAALAGGEPVAAALAAGVRVATRSVLYPGALGWAVGACRESSDVTNWSRLADDA